MILIYTSCLVRGVQAIKEVLYDIFSVLRSTIIEEHVVENCWTSPIHRVRNREYRRRLDLNV